MSLARPLGRGAPPLNRAERPPGSGSRVTLAAPRSPPGPARLWEERRANLAAPRELSRADRKWSGRRVALAAVELPWPPVAARARAPNSASVCRPTLCALRSALWALRSPVRPGPARPGPVRRPSAATGPRVELAPTASQDDRRA